MICGRSSLAHIFNTVAVAASVSFNSTTNNSTRSQHNDTRVGWVDNPNCGRGTLNILWQCLFTIFLCTYVALHLNIPPTVSSLGYSIFRKTFWVLIGLIFPEFICLNALEQYLFAKVIVKRCEKLGEPISLQQGFVIMSRGIGFRDLDRHTNGRDENSGDYSTNHLGDDPPFDPSAQEDLAQSKPAEKVWLYVEDENEREAWDYASLAFAAANTPSDKVISAISKANTLAKALTALQAIWTLSNIIARAVEKLDIALLEYATAAYILIAIFTYGFWFRKPYDIEMPFVVDAKTALAKCDGSNGRPRRQIDWKDWSDASEIAIAPQDSFSFTLWRTFDFDAALFRIGESKVMAFILVGVNGLFAGAHCLAWNYSFANEVELWLWRVNAVLMLVVPVIVSWIFWFQLWDGAVATRSVKVYSILAWALVALYVLVRLYMIAECFRALANSPRGVYENVTWTALLGHLGG